MHKTTDRSTAALEIHDIIMVIVSEKMPLIFLPKNYVKAEKIAMHFTLNYHKIYILFFWQTRVFPQKGKFPL